ncbi:MAG TPA: serine protease [Sedimenticola thiotaurini]|uniref:Serine protease n=1 Tax=Sedimenticola thiotaurini TaxID=1543721 RepID=A0A831W1U4_9GAMM|nr:serine protease [Sedimenticola thiotaurini]
MKHKTVSLVLGSGGARGLAHIGVIQWLEQNGYRIRSIAGSSMGALVGGIYAAGELETYTRWVLALEQIDVLRLLDFSFRRSGLLKGEKVIETLRDLIGDRAIESLPVSFTAVATAVQEEKEVWLNHGSLFDAIRASIAIPTVFTPVELHGRILVDGGLVNPVPIAPTLKDKTDLTIAVNLGAKAEPHLDVPHREVQPPGNSYRRHIARFIDSLQQRLGRGGDSEEMDVFQVVTSSFETMQNTIARFKLAAYSPDVVIDIPHNVCTFYEFYRAAELIELGRERAEQAMAE